MKYLSVCSGIEAATVAWNPLGWEPVGFSEIETFPCAVLTHHYPNVPNYGDMTKCDNWEIKNEFDILVGGTPCQSFSLAGKRAGMDDQRGRLAIKFFDIVKRYNPKWIVWENVPGVITSNQGRDFGLFLSEMGKCGYGYAYRILDAQHFGVPQRRRRVFVVGHFGDWRCAAAVLFERESLLWNPEKGGKKRQNITTVVATGSGGSSCETGKLANDSVKYAKAFTAASARKTGTICLMDQTPTLTSQTKRGDTEPCVVTCESVGDRVAPTLTASNDPSRSPQSSEVTQQVAAVHKAINAVRRLTPRECERLQGFPDDYTLISFRNKSIDKCPDGPRYKALGNSMAVPVMRWIGNRIKVVSQILEEKKS